MSKFQRAFLFQLAGMALLVGLIAFLARQFGLVEYVIHMQKKIDEMHAWGGFLYVPLRAACNILLLPGSVLTVASGLCFGLWWGFLLSLLGNLLGAAVTFGISRKLGRDWVSRKFSKYPKWRLMDEAVAREGWKIIFLSQLHPLFPLSLLSYLYGVTRVGFWRCMLWITLGQAPGLFLYTYFGTLAQLGIKVYMGENHPRLFQYATWIGGLALALLIALALGRVAMRMMADVERKAQQEAEGKEKSPELQKSLF